MSRQPNSNVKGRGVVPVPGAGGPSMPPGELASPNCEIMVLFMMLLMF